MRRAHKRPFYMTRLRTNRHAAAIGMHYTKDSTVRRYPMDWITGMQNALNYIEAHLDQPLTITDIARQAACSPYYFQRIFRILCGMTAGEYIRGRRLSLAGEYLTDPNNKVIDAALLFGYESAESFSRAFSAFHGISPSQARKQGVMLQYMRPLTVQILLKGGNFMHYTVVEKPAFSLMAKSKSFPISLSPQNEVVPAFWGDCVKDGSLALLDPYISEENPLMAVCIPQETSSDSFTYAIGVPTTPQAEIPSGLQLYAVPAHTWICFTCIGPAAQSIGQAWEYAFREFFPSSLYQPLDTIDIEVYTPGDTDAADYQCELWIPVTRK